jgi:hypothetical protein
MNEHRFSRDAWAVERSPEFADCMARRTDYGQYWLSIRFVWFKAGGLIFWTTLFGLVIFSRFWRSRLVGPTMGNWITLKKTPLVSKKRLMLLGALVLGLALFVLLDVPQTVRMKALVINMLPLDAQTKVDTVENLFGCLCRKLQLGQS